MKYQREKTILIDFQYLLGNNNQLFPKEMTIMQADTFIINYFLFKAPYPEEELSDDIKTQNHYSFQKINFLDWNEGDTSYNKIKEILEPYSDENYTVLVKGYEKKKFLEKYLDNVCLINMPGRLQDYTKYRHGCPVHSSVANRCAVLHIINMFMFLEKTDKLE